MVTLLRNWMLSKSDTSLKYCDLKRHVVNWNAWVIHSMIVYYSPRPCDLNAKVLLNLLFLPYSMVFMEKASLSRHFLFPRIYLELLQSWKWHHKAIKTHFSSSRADRVCEKRNRRQKKSGAKKGLWNIWIMKTRGGGEGWEWRSYTGLGQYKRCHVPH